jgi:hypothetical protein
MSIRPYSSSRRINGAARIAPGLWYKSVGQHINISSRIKEKKRQEKRKNGEIYKHQKLTRRPARRSIRMMQDVVSPLNLSLRSSIKVSSVYFKHFWKLSFLVDHLPEKRSLYWTLILRYEYRPSILRGGRPFFQANFQKCLNALYIIIITSLSI